MGLLPCGDHNMLCPRWRTKLPPLTPRVNVENFGDSGYGPPSDATSNLNFIDDLPCLNHTRRLPLSLDGTAHEQPLAPTVVSHPRPADAGGLLWRGYRRRRSRRPAITRDGHPGTRAGHARAHTDDRFAAVRGRRPAVAVAGAD